MPIEFNQPESQPQQSPKKSSGLSWNMEINFGSRKISLEQRMIFTERLLLLLQTGVSLVEALKVMQVQSSDETDIADIISSIADTITEGKTFSLALAKHPEMFSGTYVSLVAAAEEGGFLPHVLEQLLKMDEKNNQLRNHIMSALSYPAFLIAFSIAVVIFVLVVIFPKFESLFASIHDQLPITTIFLMAASSFFRHYWIWILLGLAMLTWGGMQWLKSSSGQLAIDQLKMRFPIVKDIYIKIYLNQTLSVLGLSLSNGVPITLALKASQDVVKNVLFAQFLDNVSKQIHEGRGISVGFNSSPFVPPMVRQMISTGEQTGNLGLVMTRIAEFYERDINKRITVLSKSVEPIMLIVMGVVVGLIVVSLILPIFKLSRAVH